MSSGGRDPRRLFAQTERAAIAARQRHMCGVCKRELPEVFHVHHVIPWISGGPTDIDNGIAVCPDCHHRAPILAFPGFDPREWQDEGAPHILRSCAIESSRPWPLRLALGRQDSPDGSFLQLAKTGDVGRMVWFVPNRNLRRQVKKELGAIGMHLDTDTVTERPDRDGVILTYHALSDARKLQQIIRDARRDAHAVRPRRGPPPSHR